MELPLDTYMRSVPRWIPFAILFELLLGLAAILFPVYIPFLIIVAISGVLLFLIKPELGYYLTILALGFDGITLSFLKLGFVPGARTINVHHIFIPLGFLVLLIKIVRDKLEVQKSGLEMPLFFFLGWMLISTLWAPKFIAGFVVILQVLVALVFFFSILQFFREGKLIRSVVMIWFILGLVNTVLTFLFPHGFKFSPFVGLHWAKAVIGRAQAFTYHANTLATELNLSILLGFGLLFSAKSRRSKWLYILSLTAMSAAFILTMSRGWIVALPIGIAFFFYKMRKLKKLISVSVAGLVIAVFLFLVIPEAARQFVWRFFRTPIAADVSEIQVEGATKTLDVRARLWERGFEVFQDSYGLGTGAGGYAATVTADVLFYLRKQPHSLYLTIIFELGLVGVVLFLWLLVTFLWKIESFSKQIRGRPIEPLFSAWYAAWITILLNGFLRITFGSIPFWSFMALGIIMMKTGLEQRKNV